MQILIVDLGSQYTLLINRALRELGVRSIILPPRTAERWADEHRDELKGIIYSGGGASIRDLQPEDLAPSLLVRQVPQLGICLGMHWMAQSLGGRVEPITERRGYGEERIHMLERHTPIFSHVTRARNIVWMSHGDSVTNLPPNFHRIARTEHCPVAAMASDDHMFFGVQFHPEVRETECGKEILAGFLALCGTKRDWESADVVEQIRQEVAAAVGPDGKAILAFSGGVDSSTLTAIVAPVLGNRLICATIDHGGLRVGEREEIAENALAAGCWISQPRSGRPSFHEFSRNLAFLEAVASAGTDAEAKRRAFREQYKVDLEILAAEADATFLLQGTLAPDIIESGGVGQAARIVTHHNVGMNTWLRQLHPFAGLFKYEIRDLARYLKLPASITERKPFPGPGLYCRVVGATVTAELLEVVRWADAEVRRIVAEAGIENEFDQLVVALLCVNVAGVKGDSRAYAFLAAVRAVRTSDFMTCRGYQFPPRPDNSAPIRKRIEKALVKHPRVVGVVFDETDKPPRRTEFE